MGKLPIIIGRKPTRVQLVNNELIEFDLLVDLSGVEWIPFSAMMHILGVNSVSMTVLRKEEETKDGKR